LSYGRLMLDKSIAYYDGDGNLVMPALVTAMTNLTTSANENVKPTASSTGQFVLCY